MTVASPRDPWAMLREGARRNRHPDATVRSTTPRASGGLRALDSAGVEKRVGGAASAGAGRKGERHVKRNDPRCRAPTGGRQLGLGVILTFGLLAGLVAVAPSRVGAPPRAQRRRAVPAERHLHRHLDRRELRDLVLALHARPLLRRARRRHDRRPRRRSRPTPGPSNSSYAGPGHARRSRAPASPPSTTGIPGTTTGSVTLSVTGSGPTAPRSSRPAPHRSTSERSGRAARLTSRSPRRAPPCSIGSTPAASCATRSGSPTLGPDTAQAVQVTDQLPTGSSLADGHRNRPVLGARRLGQRDLRHRHPGQRGRRPAATSSLVAPTSVGITIVNRAIVTGSGAGDPNLANNVAERSTLITATGTIDSESNGYVLPGHLAVRGRRGDDEHVLDPGRRRSRRHGAEREARRRQPGGGRPAVRRPRQQGPHQAGAPGDRLGHQEDLHHPHQLRHPDRPGQRGSAAPAGGHLLQGRLPRPRTGPGVVAPLTNWRNGLPLLWCIDAQYRVGPNFRLVQEFIGIGDPKFLR